MTIVTSGDQDPSPGTLRLPRPATIMRNELQHTGRRGGCLMVKLLYLDYSATAVMTWGGGVEILTPQENIPGDTATEEILERH